MKQILIALDYDPTAQKVAEIGFSLAKALGAKILLLHVISDTVFYSTALHDPIMGFGGYANIDFLQSNIIANLKKTSQLFLNKSKKHLGDTSIQTLVKEGDAAEIILEIANQINADIIIMGSHSRKWLDKIVMGSATKKVLHNTSIPLFIIPTKKQR